MTSSWVHEGKRKLLMATLMVLVNGWLHHQFRTTDAKAPQKGSASLEKDWSNWCVMQVGDSLLKCSAWCDPSQPDSRLEDVLRAFLITVELLWPSPKEVLGLVILAWKKRSGFSKAWVFLSLNFNLRLQTVREIFWKNDFSRFVSFLTYFL